MLDRMVHLLSRGCVLPVIAYVRGCWEKQDTDISLIRHFVTEVSLVHAGIKPASGMAEMVGSCWT